MKRIPIIAANWKMQLTEAESKHLATFLKENYQPSADLEVLLFPSFLHIASVRDIIAGSGIYLGGQNLSFAEKGAYTGEVAAFQLADIGCTHVLVGHSERRHYFHEDYETVNQKVKAAISSHLKVVLCIGESADERKAGVTEMVIVDQLESAFSGIDHDKLASMVIAYEPIWAIGTGKPPKPEDAAHVHQIVRKTIRRLYAPEIADNIRILYGGSIDAKNIKAFMAQEEVDGVLVGGASLDAKKFLQCLKNWKD
ncbi:MAG: triose-phosphate isomerase [Candidatus Hydrogenedentota bacterium]|nr:MAG: triose-phosphate isomerase [Candidatus Hydrogenedentota bacterium]